MKTRICFATKLNSRDIQEILEECLSFHKDLYTIKLTNEQDPSIINRFFPKENSVHLSQEENNSCEGPLMEN